MQGRPEAQGRPGVQGFRKLAPQKSLKLQCSSNMSINSMQGNIKRSYALRTPTLARTCAIAADYSGHANFVRQGKSPPFIFMDIGFFSKELQRNLLLYATLTWLGPSKPFLQSEHRLVGLLTGTSWDISKKSGGISALRARLSTSLDVNKANGMLTSNAKRIFCDNVTCFRTNNCCSNRSHLPECFIKAPHFLLERVQLSTCFPMSLSPAYTLQLPPICVLHPDLKKFCSNKPSGHCGHFSLEQVGDISNNLGGISALRAHLSTSLAVNKANGMLTSNAQRIFCHNVTWFGTNKCCSNRSHLPERCIKAPHLLLAWFLCFFTSQHTRWSWL